MKVYAVFIVGVCEWGPEELYLRENQVVETFLMIAGVEVE